MRDGQGGGDGEGRRGARVGREEVEVLSSVAQSYRYKALHGPLRHRHAEVVTAYWSPRPPAGL